MSSDLIRLAQAVAIATLKLNLIGKLSSEELNMAVELTKKELGITV